MTYPRAWTRRRLIAATAGVGLSALAAPALADERQALVERAKLAVDSLREEANFRDGIASLLSRAHGAFVMPNKLRAGFFLGAEGGKGLLLAREQDGTWSAPAFYNYGSGSIGLQFGLSWSEVLLIILTRGGLEQFVEGQVKLGADLSLAVGPVGASIGGGTTLNLDADIVVYARTEGLFAGGAIEGTVISARDDDNTGYYGPDATARAIVMERRFDAAATYPLRQALGGVR
jgi:lipid-binding SYLF domain-containing protein